VVVIQAINNGMDFYLQKGGEPVAQFAEFSNKIRYAFSRHLAEEALCQREHEVTTLVENATDMIVRFDSGMRYIYTNRAVERFFGVPVKQMIGKTQSDSNRKILITTSNFPTT
jgi:PAS domain-containing protein